MPEEKTVNSRTVVTTTALTITVFTEYVEGDYWILRSGFWDDLGIWIDTVVWID